MATVMGHNRQSSTRPMSLAVRSALSECPCTVADQMLRFGCPLVDINGLRVDWLMASSPHRMPAPASPRSQYLPTPKRVGFAGCLGAGRPSIDQPADSDPMSRVVIHHEGVDSWWQGAEIIFKPVTTAWYFDPADYTDRCGRYVKLEEMSIRFVNTAALRNEHCRIC